MLLYDTWSANWKMPLLYPYVLQTEIYWKTLFWQHNFDENCLVLPISTILFSYSKYRGIVHPPLPNREKQFTLLLVHTYTTHTNFNVFAWWDFYVLLITLPDTLKAIIDKSRYWFLDDCVAADNVGIRTSPINVTLVSSSFTLNIHHHIQIINLMFLFTILDKYLLAEFFTTNHVPKFSPLLYSAAQIHISWPFWLISTYLNYPVIPIEQLIN